jgi:hypothetical protein
MDKWQYRTIYVTKQLVGKGRDAYRDWSIKYSDIGLTTGLDNILNVEGKNGWELVEGWS